MNGSDSVEATVLFETPQSQIASLVRSRLEQCESASLVAGFVTVDGINAISDPLFSRPGKLELLVIGAGTHKAFEACDRLIRAGVEGKRLQVHLGFTRRSGGGFAKYHPMLHSKVYLMEMPGGRACVFIGSHNLTGFAMKGLNGEAGVLLEGASSAREFDDVRAHIAEAATQAVEYEPSMKEAYNWWAVEFLGGLKGHIDDRPKDDRGSPTIVVLAACLGSGLPAEEDVVYFEIPDAITAMRKEVHLFLFDELPASPELALDQRKTARSVLRGVVVGLEDGRGGVELVADWQVRLRGGTSTLAATTERRVRPAPRDGMQQVRVEVLGVADEDLQYEPLRPKRSWSPILEETEATVEKGSVKNVDDAGDFEFERGMAGWYRVVRLEETGGHRASAYRQAVLEMSPESGSFTLMLRRLRAPE